MLQRLNSATLRSIKAVSVIASLLWIPLTSCEFEDGKEEISESEHIAWFSQLRDVKVGHAPPAGLFHDVPDARWRNMGFERHDGEMRRFAQLDKREDLVRTPPHVLPGVDCIAIISVDRGRDYLHRTLKSIFETFPVGVEINVLVGDSNVRYVSHDVLAQILPPQFLRHVHVFAATPEAADFMNRYFDTKPRAGWNASRALRSYSGEEGLLLLEDDVEWSRDGVQAFSRAMQGQRDAAPVVTLFNYYCERVNGAPPIPPIEPMIVRPDMKTVEYFLAQTMYYAPQAAAAAGDFLLLQMHRNHYDILLNEFYHEQQLQLGYVYPGVVQHIGGDSTVGTNWWPQSGCLYGDVR